MNFSPDALAEARKEGYNDDEIFSHLASTDPRFAEAQKAGYKLDDVAQHFASQAAPASVPRGTDQESAQDPSFFSPGEVAKRAGEGLVSGTPGLKAGINLAEGKPAYASGAEGAGQIAGDIGGAAAAVASGGIVPLAKFAGLSAALNAAGVPQGAHAVGNAVENKADQLTGADKPFVSKGQGIDLAMLANLAKQLPGAAADTAVEALPAYFAGKAALGEHAPVGAEESINVPKVPVPAEPTLTPAQIAAKDLQDHGYPVTSAHMNPGDTSLKAAMVNPATAAEAEAYRAKLDAAQKADVSKPLDVGDKSTQQLGEDLQKAHQNAINARSKSYKDMLALADSPRGPAMTDIGEFTHAGQAFSQSVDADVAKKLDGLSLTQAKIKALTPGGGGLTPYDVKAGDNQDDVAAALKFGDLASQKAASPTQLADLASSFAKTEKLFQPGQGGASSSGFLRDVQGKAVDLAGDIIKKRDAAMGVAGAPAYDAWAQQRANWAKSADLVKQFEGKLSAPTTRLTGEEMYSQKMTSPEEVFQKHFANAGANKVTAYKDFLQSNGQDPALVEQMGKDWLSDLGEKSPNPIATIGRAWAKMSPEWKQAVYSPETISEMDQALERAARSEAPLKVLGTQARNGSQTGAVEAIKSGAKAAATHGGAIGTSAILGTLMGGPIGGIAGVGLGAAGEAIARGRAAAQDLATARAAFEPADISPAKPSMMTRAATAGANAANVALPKAAEMARSMGHGVTTPLPALIRALVAR
jgi:hypothetical protein